MSAWDVFRADQAEILRNQSTSEVRDALADGRLRDDDLVRPASTRMPWTALGDVPALALPADRLTARLDPASAPVLPTTPPPAPSPDANGDSAVALPVAKEDDSELALPVSAADLVRNEPDPEAEIGSRLDYAPPITVDDEGEDEEDGGGVLTNQSEDKVEELDLTAMVDIAMQLVMFFLITSTTVFFKSLEIPAPDPEKPKSAQQAAVARSLDELDDTNILVELDARGQLMVDHEPITAEALVPKLRAARDATGRTGILLMADYATQHRNAVRVLEAANEIGLATRLGHLSNSGGGGDGFGGPGG